MNGVGEAGEGELGGQCGCGGGNGCEYDASSLLPCFPVFSKAPRMLPVH